MFARRLLSAAGPLAGPGLHSGAPCSVVLQPAAVSSGLQFARLGDGRQAPIPATLECAAGQRRRTALVRGATMISTVEHVLAALHGVGIRDALVLVEGPELPAFDGSAEPIATALLAASVPCAASAAQGGSWEILARFACSDGPASCALAPGPTLRIDCAIEFDHPAIGAQQRSFELDDPQTFLDHIAPARTFGFAREAAELQRAGLARGASTRTALVFGDEQALDAAGLRFADEPVRHKILDAIGDLALLGAPLRGELQLRRCSHALLVRTLRGAIAAGVLRRAPRG